MKRKRNYMGKAYDSLFLQHLLFPTTTPSFLPTRNHHNPTRNVHPPMRDLALNRFKIAINPIRFSNLSSPFCAAMADANKKSTDQAEDLSVKANKIEDKDLDKVEKINASPPLPPPPEKPLPGDCCGSGCVRCVWDVYYEELDAYEKLRSS